MSDLITRARKHFDDYGHPSVVPELIEALERTELEVKRLQAFEKFVFSDNKNIKAFTEWNILRDKTLEARKRKRHPFAFPNNKGGFTDGNGVGVKEGDRVAYEFDKRTAVLDEALHDGDAFITFEDGEHATVKWHHLAKIE